MTILIANANGKIGQETVAALIAAGEKVRVGARTPARAAVAFPGAEVVAFDYLDHAVMASALDGVSGVFSIAPYELLPNAEIDLVAAAKAAGVTRIVKLSGMGVEQNPAALHRIAEVAIEQSGLEWTFLRANFFMQNYSTVSAGSIKASGAFYEPAGDGATSFVDTRDIGAIAAQVLTQAGHTGMAYALTGPEALDRNAVAAAISEATGKMVKYVAVDDAALRGAMAGAPPALTELMSTLMGYVRAGYTAEVTSAVPQLLGRPAISFAKFARDHAGVWM